MKVNNQKTEAKIRKIQNVEWKIARNRLLNGVAIGLLEAEILNHQIIQILSLI